jgi:hypothetical protein
VNLDCDRLSAVRDVEPVVEPDARADRAVHAWRRVSKKVARLHLACIDADLTQLSSMQAGLHGVDSNGPFKTHYYRY